MSYRSPLQARIDALQQELKDLRRLGKKAHISPLSLGPAGGFKTNPAKVCLALLRKQCRQHNPRQHRLARVIIAAGIALTTRCGSLYATICKVLARLGHLERHDDLFNQFKRERTLSSAQHLLKQISVPRTKLEKAVRADLEYQEHCENRSAEYQEKAAKGIKKYQRILQDRNICDAHGNWVGDITEAICILSSARTIAQVRRGKNLQIVNKAGLMFDCFMIGEVQYCVLYKQTWHRQFKYALALVTGRSK